MTNFDAIEAYLDQNDELQLSHVMDYKNGHLKVLYLDFSMRIHLLAADGLRLPYFVALHYLPPDFATPMYYIVPINHAAKVALMGQEPWQTVLQHSKWQHQQRGIQWNQFEVISSKLHNPYHATCLSELPNEPTTYPLPKMEI